MAACDHELRVSRTRTKSRANEGESAPTTEHPRQLIRASRLWFYGHDAGAQMHEDLCSVAHVRPYIKHNGPRSYELAVEPGPQLILIRPPPELGAKLTVSIPLP